MNASVQTAPLTAALAQLGAHDHFCSIYEGLEEHHAVAIPFLALRRSLKQSESLKERCFFMKDWCGI
jgi:hypothetical protein